MVKQVTGPSAVQVAVLKTSLHGQIITHKRYTRKPGNTDQPTPARGDRRSAELVRNHIRDTLNGTFLSVR